MNGPNLRGLPAFLRYARTYPPPEPLLASLAHGPLASLGACLGAVWRLDGDELVSIARFGSTVEESERYARIPLVLDFNICEAVRSRQTLVGPARDDRDTGIGVVDGDFWNALVERVGGISLVSAPLVLGDDVVGAFGFMTDTAWTDDPESHSIVDIVASVLALWLTHPLSAIPAVDPVFGRGQWSVSLTERQAAILRRIETGLSNRHIAVSLGLSDATVKQEVQHAMRTMRASDRRTAAERARALGLL